MHTPSGYRIRLGGWMKSKPPKSFSLIACVMFACCRCVYGSLPCQILVNILFRGPKDCQWSLLLPAPALEWHKLPIPWAWDMGTGSQNGSGMDSCIWTLWFLMINSLDSSWASIVAAIGVESVWAFSLAIQPGCMSLAYMPIWELKSIWALPSTCEFLVSYLRLYRCVARRIFASFPWIPAFFCSFLLPAKIPSSHRAFGMFFWVLFPVPLAPKTNRFTE
jgi:hypothetical protein